MNLRIEMVAAHDTADFSLLVSATEPGLAGYTENVATIASLSVDDPELGPKLRLIAQAFRMGARHGVFE